MLKSLKEFFQAHVGAVTDGDNDKGIASVELAAAVLMVEISMADSTLQETERKVMEDILQRVFHLSDADSRDLIALAEQEVDHAVSLHEFTSFLNNTLTLEERTGIVESLWRVAFADAVLDKYEEYFVRKIADLLYVPHRDYIRAKHKANSSNKVRSEK